MPESLRLTDNSESNSGVCQKEICTKSAALMADGMVLNELGAG